MNKYTGEYPIEFGDGSRMTVVYDWAALSELHSKHGDVRGKLDVSASADFLMDVLLIGLKRKQPDVTADKISGIMPPFIEVLRVVNAAMIVAYFGPEAIKEEAESPKA